MTNWKNRIVGYDVADPAELLKLANPMNPRRHPEFQEDAVEGSLNEVGWVQDVVINKTTGRMIDGHLRVKSAVKTGQEAVPVKYVELTEAEEALVLATFDYTTNMAEFDDDVMKSLLSQLDTDEPGLMAMLDEMRDEFGVNGAGGDGEGTDTEPEVDKAEAEKYQEIWQVKPGDVWQLGRHKIACIDSTDEAAVTALIDNDTVGMVWSDPPYGVSIVAANVSVGGGEAYDIPFGGVRKGYVGGGDRIKASPGLYPIETWAKNKKNSKRLGSSNGAKPFGKEKAVTGTVGASNVVEAGKYAPVIGDDTIETAVKSAELCLRMFEKAVQFWWGGNYYTTVLSPSPCWVIWDKDNTGNFADCEMAWTNQKTAARIFEHRWNGMLKASEHGQRRVHPTQKPIALAEWCFTKYGKPGDVIFDPFLGSGISIIAAENLDDDRRVIGCELAPEYIATVCQRYFDHTGITPTLIYTHEDL